MKKIIDRLDKIASELEGKGYIGAAAGIDVVSNTVEAFYDDPNIPGAEDEDEHGRPIRRPMKVPGVMPKKDEVDRDDYRPRGVSTLY